MRRQGRERTSIQVRPRRFHLFLQTLVIISGMAGLFGAIGWVVFGKAGLYWSMTIAAVLFLTTPRISPWMVLKAYRARMLEPRDAPGLYELLAALSDRAGLPARPRLYYVPSRIMNAFSVGTPSSSAIALSDGLLRALNRREIAGVLAHEITHIRNNDLRLHALADLMTRVTSAFSFMGQVLIVFYLPLAFLYDTKMPLVPILLLVFAPSVSMMLQLALSRTREFDADLGAAALTGDPLGLASALGRMDRIERGLWDIVFLPGRRNPEPSLLRTHPGTAERIRRLEALAARPGVPVQPWNDAPHVLAPHVPPVEKPPGWGWFRPRH
jgi:heat shock protein HtpX